MERISTLKQRGAGFLICLLVLASSAIRVGAAETVTITEFLAHNTSGLIDEDGANSDWIEIFNSGPTATNIGGWFLTDTAADLTKWRFPATTIAPSGFLIVFASSKNRAVSGAPLHANFGLNASGEYLALVKPDGVTIATEFAPAFPAQFANISYGLAQDLQVTPMVSNTSPALVFVPTNERGPTAWATKHTFPVSPCETSGPMEGSATLRPQTACWPIRPSSRACSPKPVM
jgi:hypothetical protein